MNAPMDEDERQEYECLLLEGHSPFEARRLARAANDRINSRRLSGPTTGDTRNGHGRRPLISDMTKEEYWEATKSLGVDGRTQTERDVDQASEVRVDRILGWLTDRQRELVIHKFGIGVEAAATEAELAERLGITKMSASSAWKKVRQKIQAIEGEGGYEQWHAAVKARRYVAGNQGRKARYNKEAA